MVHLDITFFFERDSEQIDFVASDYEMAYRIYWCCREDAKKRRCIRSIAFLTCRGQPMASGSFRNGILEEKFSFMRR